MISKILVINNNIIYTILRMHKTVYETTTSNVRSILKYFPLFILYVHIYYTYLCKHPKSKLCLHNFHVCSTKNWKSFSILFIHKISFHLNVIFQESSVCFTSWTDVIYLIFIPWYNLFFLIFINYSLNLGNLHTCNLHIII